MGFFVTNSSLLADQSLSCSVLKRRFNSDDRHPELETAMKISASPQSQDAKDRPKNIQPVLPLAPKPASGPVPISSHTPHIKTSPVQPPHVTSSKRSVAQPSSVCFDAAPELEEPSAKCRRLDASQKNPTEKIQKKILLRRLAWPTPPVPSDEKKISAASPQSQDAKDRPKNIQPVLPLAPKPASGPVPISSHTPRVKTFPIHAPKVTSSDRSVAQPSSVCIDPVSDLEDPSAKCRRLDASQENPTEKIQKKILLRRLARPTPPAPSAASPQSQDAKDRPKNIQPVLPLAPKPAPVPISSHTPYIKTAPVQPPRLTFSKRPVAETHCCRDTVKLFESCLKMLSRDIPACSMPVASVFCFWSLSRLYGTH
ncbi:uncharacterized protein LOC130547497 [Triplophysa rosa]|uniref:uncharacterized protein LOC130547497 n=1 Tax=Triplophysa rosa TaxID=992332 RepID=UPI002545C7D9|nr:uncharacterized protein LOC130547497 [Triplophysa rosa]